MFELHAVRKSDGVFVKCSKLILSNIREEVLKPEWFYITL